MNRDEDPRTVYVDGDVPAWAYLAAALVAFACVVVMAGAIYGFGKLLRVL